MTEQTYSFRCLKFSKKSDGTVGHYVLVIKDETDGEIVKISVTPKDLASSRSMKLILLGRKILYSVTQSKHEKMLSELFAIQPDEIASNVSAER